MDQLDSFLRASERKLKPKQKFGEKGSNLTGEKRNRKLDVFVTEKEYVAIVAMCSVLNYTISRVCREALLEKLQDVKIPQRMPIREETM